MYVGYKLVNIEYKISCWVFAYRQGFKGQSLLDSLLTGKYMTLTCINHSQLKVLYLIILFMLLNC